MSHSVVTEKNGAIAAQRTPKLPAVGARPVVLIPALKPETSLLGLVEELSALPDIGGIIVVDDGSGPEYREIFRSLAQIENVCVLTHFVNLGKGAALKTGLNYAACIFSRSVGVVTADADGQHSAEDIARVAAALASTPQHLVIGARAFDTNAPFRSRFGNTLTRYIMRAVTGQTLSDTQTGLRGIPLGFVPDLLRRRPTGYDFELDMLVTSRDANRPIREVPISTIYIDNNRSSHFNPLRDSMRIYFVFLRFSAVSLMTAAIDNGIFLAGMHFFPDVALCQVAGRLSGGMFQFTAAKRKVFNSQVRVAPAMAKYCTLLVFSGTLSYLLIQAMMRYTPLGLVPAKLSAETILFFVSFIIQRDVVFVPLGSGVDTGSPQQ